MVPVVLSMLSLAPFGDYEEGWSIEYDSYIEGPRTVFEGTARLYMTEDSKFPCLSYCFDIPEGRLAGPAIFSSPNDPILPFDWWERSGDELEVLWCRDNLPLHPFTGEDIQTYPVQTPKNFKFYIIKTRYNGNDLTKLLSEWGSQRSVWDLNEDNAVDGKDLTILLAGWSVN